MEIVHLDPAEYRTWRKRLGPKDIAHVRRRMSLLAEHGVEIGLPNVRRIDRVVWELRIPTGARLYFTLDDDIAFFVKYGNKDTQRRDISVAINRAQELHEP